MRLGILIRDSEYRDAFVQKLSHYDNDIFVNILGKQVKDTSECVILTDIQPLELDEKTLKTLKSRTLFITTSEKDVPADCNYVFKFSSIPEIISEVSLVYNRWHGNAQGIDHSAKLISVCCESDAYSSERCRALAGQIIYSHGGSVLILPLSYINDYGISELHKGNSLSRLLYSIRSGRETNLESLTHTDAYGVSAMLLPPGINPVSYLDEEELRILIFGLSKRFDTVIVDVGTCFRKENIALMKESDHVIFFERGRRTTGIDELFANAGNNSPVRLRITGDTDDILVIQDCVKQIYGVEKNESVKDRDSKEIRR